MSTYGARTTADRDRADYDKPTRTLSLIAGLLGVLMFIWGFLKWLNIGDASDHQQKIKYAGYAFSMPTTAVIGLSLAAGLIALLGATERRRGRGVAIAVPTGLAATSFLVALGILLDKGSISPDVGDKVGVEIGLILGLITAILQTIVLLLAWARRRDDDGAYAEGYTTTSGDIR